LNNKPISGKSDVVDLKNLDKEDDAGKLFSLLVSIMGRLRSENGCVWDREQTHESIKKNLLEETYEAVETIENKDYQGLKEELGDILLQVVFHSQISSENKNFEINDVIRHIIKKLIRRHPHVFGDKIACDSTEVLSSWEEIKKEERRENRKKEDISMFSDIPNIMPSLHYAFEIQNRASRVGFDWENTSEVFEKITEELKELNVELIKIKSVKISDEIGDILFSVVNLSRHLKIDCEKSLRDTCKKFITRFVYMEKYAERNMLDFKSLPLSRKDKLWEIAKQAENKKNSEADL
jgi:tetrapyrrole methylase family protein / MazG family protein